MALDVNTILTEALKQAPAILVAAGGLIWQLRRNAQKLEANQKRIENKVNGNHKITLKAIKLAGKYEGHQEARREVKEDLDHAVKTVKVAAKRGPRRATDKT